MLYEVQEAVDGGVFASLPLVKAAKVRLKGKLAGHTYHYQVRAKSPDGSYSDWVTAGNGCQVPHVVSVKGNAGGAMSIGGIIVSGVVKIPVGEARTLVVTPHEGFHVVSVVVDGVPLLTDTARVWPYTRAHDTPFTIELPVQLIDSPKNKHTVSVKFAANSYTVAANAGDGGKITPVGLKICKHGKPATYTITPYGGYKIQSIFVNGVAQNSLPSVGPHKIFLTISEDTTIDASFVPAPSTSLASPATGLWSGTFTDKYGYAYEILAIISPDNRASIWSYEGMQYMGSLKITGNQATGSFTGYAADGDVFYNGKPITTGTVSLTVNEKNSLIGTYKSSADNGAIRLFYVSQLESETSIQDIEGRWGDNSYYDWVDMTIGFDGSLVAYDFNGCVYKGKVKLPSNEWNIFSVDMKASECGGYDGTYTGLATIVYDTSVNYVVFMVSNGKYVISDTYDRK